MTILIVILIAASPCSWSGAPVTPSRPGASRPCRARGPSPRCRPSTTSRPTSRSSGRRSPRRPRSTSQPPRSRPRRSTSSSPPRAGLVRLRARLARSQSALGKGLLTLLSRDVIDEDTWEQIEDLLITADVGVGATQEIVGQPAHAGAGPGHPHPRRGARAAARGAGAARSAPTWTARCTPRPTADGPAVVLVVGVNGTGKTTTCGKLARVLVADGRTVVLGAADTFRAAAADQLATWGERVGASRRTRARGRRPGAASPSTRSRRARSRASTPSLIDTAGRLHTKTGLMDELGKVKRVVEKQGPVDEVLLVLDATTGQNGLVQARVFAEVVDVTGIVLTKLDGTAKGGIVVAVQRELGVPVKLIGLGEGPDDLAPFEPVAFVDALLERVTAGAPGANLSVASPMSVDFTSAETSVTSQRNAVLRSSSRGSGQRGPVAVLL